MTTESKIAIAMVAALAGTLLAIYLVTDTPHPAGAKHPAWANCSCARDALCEPTRFPAQRASADPMHRPIKGLICPAKPSQTAPSIVRG